MRRIMWRIIQIMIQVEKIIVRMIEVVIMGGSIMVDRIEVIHMADMIDIRGRGRLGVMRKGKRRGL